MIQDDSCAATARRLAFWGFRVLPIKPGSKRPLIAAWQDSASADVEQVAAWFEQWPSAQLGLLLGPSSGPAGVCDIESDDPAGGELLQRLVGNVATWCYSSARSTHYLFQQPISYAPAAAVEKRRGIEFRLGCNGKGSQSVIPPSKHPSGKAYAWLAGRSPDDCDLAAFPTVLLELLQGNAEAPSKPQESPAPAGLLFTVGDDCDLLTHPGATQGERNRELCRLVGKYLARGGQPDDLYKLVMAWADRCSPAYPHAEALEAARAIKVDPDDETRQRRLLLQLKNNLGDADGLAFQRDDQGKLIWEASPVLVLPDELGNRAAANKLEMAKAWLKNYLGAGEQPIAEVERIAEALSISRATLRRARQALGVVPGRSGAQHMIALPEGNDIPGEEDF